MYTLHYVIVKYRYRLQDRNAHLIVPMRAGGQLTAHPRAPEMSIPLATVTSARNTVRLQPGLRFTVSSITKTNIILTSEASGASSFRVASQAFRDDDDLPTILTSEPARLGISAYRNDRRGHQFAKWFGRQADGASHRAHHTNSQ